MPTLAADAGSFALAGQATAARLYAGSGRFSVSGQTATTGREYEVPDIDTDTTVPQLARLNSMRAIVRDNGVPDTQYQIFWQRHCEAIERAFRTLSDMVESLQGQVGAIQAAYAAAAQASEAAQAANDTTAAVQEQIAAVSGTVDQIAAGTFNFPAITVGNQKYANFGDYLEPVI